jgi:hypothetical protein
MKNRFDQENQLNQEDLSYWDNLLDSEIPFDSSFLLDSEDPPDLEDLLALEISDLRLDDVYL